MKSMVDQNQIGFFLINEQFVRWFYIDEDHLSLLGFSLNPHINLIIFPLMVRVFSSMFDDVVISQLQEVFPKHVVFFPLRLILRKLFHRKITIKKKTKYNSHTIGSFKSTFRLHKNHFKF